MSSSSPPPFDRGVARIAYDAEKRARRAEEAALESRDAYRSMYRALGEMAAEMRGMRAAVGELSEQFGRLLGHLSGPLPAHRAPAPSTDDVLREITGSHKIPSDPAAAIVRRGLLGLALRGLRGVVAIAWVKVAGTALVVVAIGASGWFARDCAPHVTHQQQR